MKPILLIASCVVISLLPSCKKDKQSSSPACTSSNQPIVTYPNYSNLKVGNYWIYQRYEINTNGFGGETMLNITDSCYIEKDTLINGYTYYKYMSSKVGAPGFSGSNQNPITAEFYRDSLSYLVNQNGRIEFSSQDFTTIFKTEYVIASGTDTVCKIVVKMGDQNLSVVTPSGNYLTSSMKEIYNMYPNWSSNGAIRYRDTRYAENIGKVTEGFYLFAGTPMWWERRLIRYHLN